jgi:hypothetical protein
MRAKIQNILTIDFDRASDDGFRDYTLRELKMACADDPNGVPEWICDMLSTTPETFRKATQEEKDALLTLVARIAHYRNLMESVRRRVLAQVEEYCSTEMAAYQVAAEALASAIEGRPE